MDDFGCKSYRKLSVKGMQNNYKNATYLIYTHIYYLYTQAYIYIYFYYVCIYIYYIYSSDVWVSFVLSKAYDKSGSLSQNRHRGTWTYIYHLYIYISMLNFTYIRIFVYILSILLIIKFMFINERYQLFSWGGKGSD